MKYIFICSFFLFSGDIYSQDLSFKKEKYIMIGIPPDSIENQLTQISIHKAK